jgi:hypothetical protein
LEEKRSPGFKEAEVSIIAEKVEEKKRDNRQ